MTSNQHASLNNQEATEQVVKPEHAVVNDVTVNDTASVESAGTPLSQMEASNEPYLENPVHEGDDGWLFLVSEDG